MIDDLEPDNSHLCPTYRSFGVTTCSQNLPLGPQRWALLRSITKGMKGSQKDTPKWQCYAMCYVWEKDND